MLLIMLVTTSTSVFAVESSSLSIDRFLPQVIIDEQYSVQSPNGIPITVTPHYDRLEVHVGNIGIDSLDNVTVSGSATDYGKLAS